MLYEGALQVAGVCRREHVVFRQGRQVECARLDESPTVARAELAREDGRAREEAAAQAGTGCRCTVVIHFLFRNMFPVPTSFRHSNRIRARPRLSNAYDIPTLFFSLRLSTRSPIENESTVFAVKYSLFALLFAAPNAVAVAVIVQVVFRIILPFSSNPCNGLSTVVGVC